MHDIRPYMPTLFGEPGTLLYIGARPDACAWLTELADVGHDITILEIWHDNVVCMSKDPRVVRAIEGDVRYLPDGLRESYDYIMWWHGPEHVLKSEFPDIVERLEKRARKLIALAAPWGVYRQGAHQGNPHEEHLWSVYENDFRTLGYEVATDGVQDNPGSEIVGWKLL